MNAKSRLVATVSALLMVAAPASAQQTVLILETTFEGDISEAVAERFRDTLHQIIASNTTRDVLSEAESREALGVDSDRLMRCGSISACLVEAGQVSGAHAAVVAAVGESGEIYAFTVDVYSLETGEAIFFTDSDCALCTVDEALAVLGTLGENAASALPAAAEAPVTASAELVTLFIRAAPDHARVTLDGQPIGAGIVQAEVGPGDHVITVSAYGYDTVEETVTVAPGDEDKVVNVRLVESAATTTVRQGGLLDGVDTVLWGGVSTGVGVASLIAGIALLVIDGNTTCSEGSDSECEDVYDTKAGGAVLSIFGAAALTAGVTLLLWDSLAGRPRTVEEGAETRAGVGVDERGAYVIVGGTF